MKCKSEFATVMTTDTDAQDKRKKCADQHLVKTESTPLNGIAPAMPANLALKDNNNNNALSDTELDPRYSTTVPTHVTVPPDGGWGWIVVAASFLCNLVVDGIIYSFGMFLIEISNSFGESKASVSLVGSLLSGSYLIAGPFASALANRYGFRTVTIIGAILGSAAFFVSSYATNVQFLYICYGILGGIGFGLIFVPAVITIGFYFEKWRALATGIAVCGSGIGTFLMAPLSNWLIEQLTWRGALIVQSGFILNCAICGVLFRPLKPISVKVPLNENPQTQHSNQSLLLKTEILKDSKEKSASLLNIYEGLGLTVEDTTQVKNFFNHNTKYPTASQILYVAADTKKSTQSLNGSVCSDKSPPKANLIAESDLDTRVKRLSNGVHRLERHHSESPEMVKATNVMPPEMRILLNRKHSLQQTPYKSKSFTVSSTTTLDDRTNSISSRRSSKTEFGNRPLYRDDIFFNSNLKRLSQYNSQSSALDYTMSVTRLPTYNDIMEEQTKACSVFPEAMRRALATMLDVSLLKSSTFILLAVSGFITSMGMYVPFMFINDRALTYGIDHSTSVWLISVLGIANTIGRVGFGVLSSIPKMNAVIISNVALTICGLSTVFSGILSTVEYQFFYATAFGLSIACFSSLRTIIVVDLLGLEKLTNAFGLLLLFQGIAAIIGPPLAGYFLVVTGSYDISFYISGALITFSAIICYPIEIINRWEKDKKILHTDIES